jgi:hypothetical protein
MVHSVEIIRIWQFNTRVIDAQKMNVQVEILGCKGEKNYMGMR